MPLYLDTRGKTVLTVAICGRCSRKFSVDDLYIDPNIGPGIRFCKDDVDQFDPWRLPARPPDKIAVRYARPDTPLTPPVGGDIITEDG